MLYCATGSSIASGVTLRAVDAPSGRILWKIQAHALGPIAHSKYFNTVQLGFSKRWIRVTGYEAGGCYIELIEPKQGKSVSSSIFR